MRPAKPVVLAACFWARFFALPPLYHIKTPLVLFKIALLGYTKHSMSESLNADMLAKLFDPETHHDYRGGVFEKRVGGEVLALSDKAYMLARKKYGSVWLSLEENVIFLALLHTWLSVDEPVVVSANDKVELSVGSTVVGPIPLAVSGLRGVTEMFNLACGHGDVIETPNPPYTWFDLRYQRNLADDKGKLIIYGQNDPRSDDEEDEEPVQPSWPIHPGLVVIEPSLVNI